VRLRAGRLYRVRVDYQADDPSQGHLLGAVIRLGWVPPVRVRDPEVERAAEVAARADAAIVIVRTYEAEDFDRPSMNLPCGQNGQGAS